MKRKLDLFEYNDNDGVGRLRTTTPSQEIAIAEKLEANMMTKAQFNALAEERKANRGGSGFDEWGKGSSIYDTVNAGMGTVYNWANFFGLPVGNGSSVPIITVNGVAHKIDRVAQGAGSKASNIIVPTAPNIYPHDTVLTAEQIASGVIKHADSSNSGLIVNGKFDTDTSGWASSTNFPAILSNADGKLRVAATSIYGRAIQGFSTVIGKKYFIKGQKTLISGTAAVKINLTNNLGLDWIVDVDNIGEFTAIDTTTYIACGLAGSSSAGAVAEFDNIAVYPADAISRSDLVFLESWHENVSEKNFVYDNGNTQSLSAANTIGVTPTNGSFTGFETYSLFGNWQTPNSLIGKGYIWSNLTEAQKRAFIANPENNCYLDGDKVIQVRYRVRAVQGAGDIWQNVDPQITDFLFSGNQLAVSSKGKESSYPDLISRVFTSRLYQKGNTGDFSAYYQSGNNSTNDRAISNNIAYEGKCFALPIALVHRRNQGMYHPVYNPNGTKKASDDKFWYDTSVSFTSISDCFDPAKLLAASGYIGSVSGRPDGLFYDQVHEGDITDLRSSSKKVEDYNRLIGREFNKLVAGTTRGKEGEKTSTYCPTTMTVQLGIWTINTNYGANSRVVQSGASQVSSNVFYETKQVGGLYDAIFARNTISGNVYKVLSVKYYTNATYINFDHSHGTVFTDTTSTYDILLISSTTRTKSNTLLHCDIIGNPSNYPTAWKQSGVFGTPLIVAEDGTSLLPDGIKDTFKLSRKANATPLLCLRSTDSGVTWTSFTPTFSTTTNAITLTDEPAGNLVMVYYQTHTSMAVPVVNSEVLGIGDVSILSSQNTQSGSYFVSSLIGKTPTNTTSPTTNTNIRLRHHNLFQLKLDSGVSPENQQYSIGQSQTPAVKVFPYLTRTNGKAYLNLVFKEMKYNGTSWGDDNKFNIVDNVSTTTDNNAQTILIGQKTVELPYFIAGDE